MDTTELPTHTHVEKKQKGRTQEDEPFSSEGMQYVTGEEHRNSTRRNEEVGPKQKQCSDVDVSGGESKV